MLQLYQEMQEGILKGAIAVTVSKRAEHPHEPDPVSLPSCLQGVVHGDNAGHAALLDVSLASIRRWACTRTVTYNTDRLIQNDFQYSSSVYSLC